MQINGGSAAIVPAAYSIILLTLYNFYIGAESFNEWAWASCLIIYTATIIYLDRIYIDGKAWM